jgi:hypothetical protein
MSEQKLLPVPDGLAGERADAGLAKLMGLSRSAAAELLTDGLVLQNSKVIGKSDRLIDGAVLEVTMPEPKNALAIVSRSSIKTTTSSSSISRLELHLILPLAGMAQLFLVACLRWGFRLPPLVRKSVRVSCRDLTLAPAGS